MQRAREGCSVALQCQGGSREAGREQRQCDAQGSCADALGANIGRRISSVDATGVGVASMRSVTTLEGRRVPTKLARRLASARYTQRGLGWGRLAASCCSSEASFNFVLFCLCGRTVVCARKNYLPKVPLRTYLPMIVKEGGH